MQTTEVAAVVGSILSAFDNGMDVFRRMTGNKRKSQSRQVRLKAEEVPLYDSLRSRPAEIQAEYNQSVAKLGSRFEIGDAVARTSLAHTLLMLNTGLVNLVKHASSDDPKTRNLSGKMLLTLSEVAAVDALTALGQLSSRLSLSPHLALTFAPEDKAMAPSVQNSKPSQRKSYMPSSRTKRPSPAPFLVRGGWVRSKSGSSVGSVASTTKSGRHKPTPHHRIKSLPIFLTVLSSKGHQGILPAHPHRLPQPRACQNTPSSLSNAWEHLVDSKHSLAPLPQRQLSMLIVPADFFSDQHTSHQSSSSPSTHPPNPPFHTQSQPSRRPRPPSTMTFLTASTKVGEIPEHHWPDLVLPEAEQGRIPMPYTIPPPLMVEEPKRKRRGFKFWKKEKVQSAMATC